MGRSQKPLTILCVGLWGDEFVTLQDKGHTIDHNVTDRPLTDYDLILGPTAHRMDDQLIKYLPLALAEGRRVKYPKENKDA